MYKQKELAHAAYIIRRIAQKHGVPEAQIRADLQEAMNAGRSNPSAAVQARWTGFHYAGMEPTAEEFILWSASLLGDKDQ